jgi:hypothetical protein
MVPRFAAGQAEPTAAAVLGWVTSTSDAGPGHRTSRTSQGQDARLIRADYAESSPLLSVIPRRAREATSAEVIRMTVQVIMRPPAILMKMISGRLAG